MLLTLMGSGVRHVGHTLRVHWICAGVFATAAGVLGAVAWHEHHARVAVVASLGRQRWIAQQTAAQLAATDADRNQYRELYAAAQAMKGTVLAGAVIRIARRDTTVVHDTLVTVVDPVAGDSTRTARFQDSTFAGTVSGTITAPPYPRALRFTYSLSRPPFTPTVGFVDVAGPDGRPTPVAGPDGRPTPVAVVTWQGERFEIADPFVRPSLTAQSPSRLTRVTRSASVGYTVPASSLVQSLAKAPAGSLTLGVGASLFLVKGTSATAGIAVPVNGPLRAIGPTVSVGVTRRW